MRSLSERHVIVQCDYRLSGLRENGCDDKFSECVGTSEGVKNWYDVGDGGIKRLTGNVWSERQGPAPFALDYQTLEGDGSRTASKTCLPWNSWKRGKNMGFRDVSPLKLGSVGGKCSLQLTDCFPFRQALRGLAMTYSALRGDKAARNPRYHVGDSNGNGTHPTTRYFAST
jgi:hypothetical protein